MYVTTANNNQASSKFCAAKTSRTYTILSLTPSLTFCVSLPFSLLLLSLTHSSFPSIRPSFQSYSNSLQVHIIIALFLPFLSHHSLQSHYAIITWPFPITTITASPTSDHKFVSFYLLVLLIFYISNVWTRLSFSAPSVTVISIIMNPRSPLILRWFFCLVTTFTHLLTIQSSFVSTSVSSSDLCYLSHGGASETFTINEAVPIGSIVGSLKVSS